MLATEQARMVATNPKLMQEVALEALRRAGQRLDTAAITDEQHNLCLDLLNTGASAALLACGEAVENTAAQVMLLGATFGACDAVADIINGCDRTGPRAVIHQNLREIVAVQRERGNYVRH